MRCLAGVPAAGSRCEFGHASFSLTKLLLTFQYSYTIIYDLAQENYIHQSCSWRNLAKSAMTWAIGYHTNYSLVPLSPVIDPFR